MRSSALQLDVKPPLRLCVWSCGDCGLIFAIQLPPRKLKVVGIVHCGANTQPWGVTAGPDGALYVSVKDAFQVTLGRCHVHNLPASF